ncbi:MAG TPA: PAS domain S-box protein [Alphaproteobacteria bacterium]|nr:PAS domain S-box protein [Alphaproteobacteria bacterium]
MRSLLSRLAGGGASTAARGGHGRPEALRRRAIATNAKLIVLFAVGGLPVALYFLTQGLVLPFVLDVLGLAMGALSLALHGRGEYEHAAAMQVYGIMLTGLVLAVVDPAIADFGLAIALLGPVHASLLTHTPVKKWAWMVLVVVVAFAALASQGLVAWPESQRAIYVGLSGSAFIAAALMVALSANRLNSVFEVYEKAQVNAYRHLVEHVQDAVMRYANDGALLFASRSSERLFGCRRYELAGSGMIERMHILDRPAYMTAFAEANRDGKSRTVEVRMRRDDPHAPAAVPQYIWVEIALSPVVDTDSPADRNEVVVLLRDITARKDQEQEMRQARKVAEETSMAKSRFLATIGHELRTPLNAIVGFSEMLTSGVVGELAPTHKEYARLIHKSGQHLIEVVKMLLDMSRIEAGKFELQTEPFQPETMIEPCLQIVEPMARDKGVRLKSEVASHLPMLVADERACRQILINLLSNAIKFSNERSVVTLSMRRQGAHLNISVADQGIGMDENAIRRLGEPFFQAQDGLARGYEGTGLGLSIVKGLVELHDGTLHAMSVPGEGTTMTVLLPINGPATKVEETGAVTPLHREPAAQQMPEWRDERKRAL